MIQPTKHIHKETNSCFIKLKKKKVKYKERELLNQKHVVKM